MNHVDDAFILTELKKKDNGYGLSIFTQKYHGYLMDISVQWYGLSREDATTCVTDTFRSAIKKDQIDKFQIKDSGSMRVWLEEIHLNKVRDLKRKEKADQMRIRNLTRNGDYDEKEPPLFYRYDDTGEFPTESDFLDDVPEDLLKKIEEASSGISFREDGRKSHVNQLVAEYFGYDGDEIVDEKRAKNYVYFRLHLMGRSHKEIAVIRYSTQTPTDQQVDATRQFVRRLKIDLCKELGKKLNKDGATIYENLKDQDRESDSESDVGQ